MLILRCTRRVLVALPPDQETRGDVVDDPVLGSWFVDLLMVRRSKCLLATHSTTLYSVLIPHARQAEFADLAAALRRRLKEAFAQETYAAHAARFFERGLERSVIGPTNSRRVLGSMNDMKSQMDLFLEPAAEIGPYEYAGVERAINHAPMSFLQFRGATDAMGELVAPRPEEAPGAPSANLRHSVDEEGRIPHDPLAGPRSMGATWDVASIQRTGTTASPARSGGFSPAATAAWNRIPPNIRLRLLNNFWCGRCLSETSVALTGASVSRGDLVLRGSCTRCAGEVTRLVENAGRS